MELRRRNMRALACHQCGSASIPGLGVVCFRRYHDQAFCEGFYPNLARFSCVLKTNISICFVFLACAMYSGYISDQPGRFLKVIQCQIGCDRNGLACSLSFFRPLPTSTKKSQVRSENFHLISLIYSNTPMT